MQWENSLVTSEAVDQCLQLISEAEVALGAEQARAGLQK